MWGDCVSRKQIIKQALLYNYLTSVHDGGEGSGNHGHKGRPGQIGGSGGGGSSSAEYSKKKLDSLPASVKPEVREIYQKSVASEPQITDDLTKIAKDVGAKMDGLDFRLKDGESFQRKVKSNANENHTSEEEAANNLYDVVRYTQVSSGKNLSQNFHKTVEILRKKGYNVVGVKNTWLEEGGAYKGVNVKMTSPDGQKFELQFHTPESLDMKEINHKHYEIQRKLPENDPEHQRLKRIMVQNAAKLTPPADIDTVR